MWWDWIRKMKEISVGCSAYYKTWIYWKATKRRYKTSHLVAFNFLQKQCFHSGLEPGWGESIGMLHKIKRNPSTEVDPGVAWRVKSSLHQSPSRLTRSTLVPAQKPQAGSSSPAPACSQRFVNSDTSWGWVQANPKDSLEKEPCLGVCGQIPFSLRPLLLKFTKDCRQLWLGNSIASYI